ncbi:MAG TPA: NADP-dependent isocitrate dehydrogenase [Anaerolinea thermolimosa]|uniref:Isocitrate dehydrogenase [NADP] n=1 Tax=Anaerolinea thermolimosa TaxID=229919 RepID=A0A3D1JKU1_9CHLR|nr:NADP-dependent isocitrate dehydrogenase [Anaerolinea thermolimosa]GAP05261.1 isocitrate dehydrogenase [Anaerolinea thermolimosa]HCE18378.1 NADP-dependent isocitrate dehydrogenase [Anaerolinea thermolimosa]
MVQTRITLAYGDGIGPEIMRAVRRILEAAGAPLVYDVVEMGETVYRRGVLSGIPPEAWEVIRANRVLLKAPMTTPQGGGYKSINVTLRISLGLFANVRPCKAYAPFVTSLHPGMDVVIIRENEEDLYGGIEHRQTREVTQVLKLISYPGTHSIVRYAFEYARAYGRRKVTCMTKDNIMKITDGLFHRVFREISQEYPDIQAEHQIIDIGAARLAAAPETLDVIVTPNLYGDILSDVAAQLTGSVGLAGSSNIGREAAMFEAIHGSAPDIAGKGIANPSGLLQAAVQMLVHVGQGETAALINNAWLCTLEDGIHTADIYREGLSRRRVNTDAFADAVIERLGREPERLRPARFQQASISIGGAPERTARKALCGVDVFLDWSEGERDPARLGRQVEGLVSSPLKLQMITNRGVKVYPEGLPETFRTDHWRCRFVAEDGGEIDFSRVIDLLWRLHQAGLEVIQTENLYTFDGERGYSPGQGE